MTQELIQANPEPETGEIIQVQAPETITLFGTSDPVQVVEKATAVANALAAIVEKQQLYTTIQGKKFPNVEAWTLIGTMLGVFPVVEWTREVHEDNDPTAPVIGYEARVEARTISGAVVGAAEHMCTRKEKTWASRDDYALKSMAQTRATSKALRGPLDFIMKLAGYVGTPAEDMPPEPAQPRPKAKSIASVEVAHFDTAAGIHELMDRTPKNEVVECLKKAGVTKTDLAVGEKWVQALDPKIQTILFDVLTEWEATHELPFYDNKL